MVTISLNWKLIPIFKQLYHWILKLNHYIQFHFRHFGNFFIEFKGWCIKCKFVSIILAIILLNLEANSSNVSIFPIFWGLFHWLLRLIHQCKYISIILKNVSLSGDCLNLKANSSNVSIFPIFWGLFHWLLRLIHQVQVYFHHFEECFIEWGLFKFES